MLKVSSKLIDRIGDLCLQFNSLFHGVFKEGVIIPQHLLCLVFGIYVQVYVEGYAGEKIYKRVSSLDKWKVRICNRNEDVNIAFRCVIFFCERSKQ